MFTHIIVCRIKKCLSLFGKNELNLYFFYSFEQTQRVSCGCCCCFCSAAVASFAAAADDDDDYDCCYCCFYTSLNELLDF